MSAITIDTSQLVKGGKVFQNMSKELAAMVDEVLTSNTLEIAAQAKRLAPVDRGFLRQNISPNTTAFLHKEVNVNAFYAAYMEFSTGAYAAQWVASLPADWQTFAAQFRGKAGGTFAEMLTSLQRWVRLKGIASGKDIKRVAYLIARSILIKGVKPHPFLYPAYNAQRPMLIKDLDNVLKQLSKVE